MNRTAHPIYYKTKTMVTLYAVQSSKCTKIVRMDEKTDTFTVVYIHPLPRLSHQGVHKVARELKRRRMEAINFFKQLNQQDGFKTLHGEVSSI